MSLSVILKPSPFRAEVVRHMAEPGQTLEQIFRDIPELPPEIWTHGVAKIGDVEVPRELWSRVRPKPGSYHMVNVGIRLGDGGGGGGKNIFATIATIALLVVAAAVSGGALAGIGGTALFAAGSASATIAAAGISIIGSLAISALFPPPVADAGGDSGVTKIGQASIEGNQLELFEPIPFVIGRHRVAPPHLILPWTEAIGNDQFANAIFGLNGAHDVSDIWINDVPIEDIPDVEYEVRDDVVSTGALTLITTQVFEAVVNTSLSQHDVKEDATAELIDVSTPANSYPIFHHFSSRGPSDEIWMHLQFASLADNSNQSAAGMPIRIEIRRKGTSTWAQLPEFHIARFLNSPFKVLIKFVWDEDDTSLEQLQYIADFGDEYIWNAAVAQVTSDSFLCHSYFRDELGFPGSGFWFAEHIFIGDDGKTLYVFIDEATFPKDAYEIRIKRGYAYRESQFTLVGETGQTYTLSGDTPYFFTHTPGSSPPSIRTAQRDKVSACSVASISTVWYEAPLTSTDGLTLIAIRAKNMAVRSVSAIFTGYVNNWDGSDWDTFEPARNPASWFRAIALGQQSIRAPYVLAQLDTSLEDWHEYCDNLDINCDVYVAGRNSVGDILELIAGSGRAVLRASDRVGVVIEEDRSSESPIQLFSQRNTSGLTVSRAFPRIPHGLRVSFRDEDNDYKTSEIFVYRAGYDSSNAVEIESVTYSGITNQARVIDRAILDLGQLTERGRLYSFSCDIEQLYCVKGSLVALAHDTIRRHLDSARVVSVQTSGSNVTGLTLDAPLRLSLIDDYDGGFPAGVIIQLKDGSTITHEIDETVDTDTITFTTPFSEPVGSILEIDCLVVAGPFSRTHLRTYVKDVKAKPDLSASLVLVDEAPILSNFYAAQLVAESASYVIAGAAATFPVSFNLSAESASYAIAAADATLTSSYNLTAASAAYTIAAADATLTGPGGLSSIAFQASNTSTNSATVTAPASIDAGDLLEIIDVAFSATTPPSAVTPTGFTNFINITHTTGGIGVRLMVSYKIASGSEDSTSITGMSGGVGAAKLIRQYRADAAIGSVNPVVIGTPAFTDGDPADILITSSGGAAPLIVNGIYFTFGTVDPRTFSPAADAEFNVGTALYAKHKLYSSSPANHTIGMDDEGAGNSLTGYYLELAA